MAMWASAHCSAARAGREDACHLHERQRPTKGKHDLGRFNRPDADRHHAVSPTAGSACLIAWWPGKVQAGSQNSHVGYFGDWLATAAELAGAPDARQRGLLISLPPAGHLYGGTVLYWEFHEGGFKQAALYQGR